MFRRVQVSNFEYKEFAVFAGFEKLVLNACARAFGVVR